VHERERLLDARNAESDLAQCRATRARGRLASAGATMEFNVLGPLEVRRDGSVVALGGGRPRALLAVLLLHANEPVSAERLAAAVWGEDAPPGAVKTVQVNVSRLRKALGDDAVLTTAAGYRLRVGPGELDANHFERLLDEGRRTLAQGRPEEAAERLRQALGLWRGPALADLAFEPFARAEIERLEEQRLAAVEARTEADLAVGRHAELVAELQRLVAEHPLRERLHGQLMLALYRSGRQADALDAYRDARGVLVEQLGIEPGTELQELQQAILAHDPAIGAPRGTRDRGSGGQSTALALAAVSALGNRRLPVPPNRTIGRGHDVRALGERLRLQSVRLLTLTGPGGVGKTRLALESARAVEADFADSAFFVSLAAVERPEDVPTAIVATLGITLLAGESPAEAVERFLAAKHLLLVIDNLEHVLAAAPLIGALLAACPGLTVIATSREVLNLSAEQRFAVPPLALPRIETADDPKALAAVDAVALFSERARARDPGFHLGAGNAAAVAEICRRVDGLPLAIELAAARCDVLSPREIAERLDVSLAALGTGARDAPARQHSLHATLDWSHDLLSHGEKACFARFAVFAGGATVAAAETVTGADLDTLDRLVAKSLLLRHQPPDTPTRLGMLETVRTYAGERFAGSVDADAVRERHYRYYLALAHCHGSDRALWGSGGKQHLAYLDADVDNLHAALRWALDKRRAESAVSLVAALGRYWVMRDRYADAAHWIEQALSIPGAECHPALRVRALCMRAHALWPLGRGDELDAVIAEAEGIARQLGDPVTLSQTLQLRVDHETGASGAGRLDVADALADEALQWARAADDRWEIAEALRVKARAASSIGPLRERTDRAAAQLEAAGNIRQLVNLLISAPYGALCLSSDRDARELLDRALPVTRELGDPLTWAIVRGNLGLATLLTGDTDTALHAFRDELRLCRELVVLPMACEGLQGLAAIAAAGGDDQRAARLAGAAAEHRYGTPEDSVDIRLRAAFLEPARRRYGADAWDAASRQGATLSFEEAIADALQEPHA
jgi:predicted ATPase/DNA-binding SARP family transcriptional activator